MSEQVIPTLAVVGCVNMGKSSIVATLAEADEVVVDPRPGSTTNCQEFDLQLHHKTVVRLVDTPGFQNPRRALDWMETWQQEHEAERATATAAVRAFVAKQVNNPQYVHECRLLQPILAGSGILYVVDGTSPYYPRFDAEMRILAMTGAPRMAVINIHGDGSPYEAEWTEALRPWFKVFSYNAMAGGMAERLRLLRSFTGIDDSWAPILEHAVANLQEEGQHRDQLAINSITDLVADCLTMEEQQAVNNTTDRSSLSRQLSTKLHNNLRKRERAQRRAIEQIYRHQHVERQEEAFELDEADLLDVESWKLLGFSKRELAAAGLVSGSLVGGGIDLSVGGTSFLAGTVIGGIVGGATALWGTDRLSKVRVLGSKLGGKVLSVRAPEGMRFAGVLLDRALIHWRIMRERAHARRDAVVLDAKPESLITGLDSKERDQLTKLCTKLQQSSAGSSEESDLRQELQLVIGRIARGIL